MKEKPYVKVAMYALNIIFAIIIIVPVIYLSLSECPAAHAVAGADDCIGGG